MGDRMFALDAENETLRRHNARLQNSLQELRTELSYFATEKKRLEAENNTMKDSLTKISLLYKEASSETAVHKIDDVDYMDLLVNYPAKSIAEIIQTSTHEPMALTTSQAPFYIEVRFPQWVPLLPLFP